MIARVLLTGLLLLGAAGPAQALEPLGERGLAVVNGGGGEFFLTPVPITWTVAHSSRSRRVVHMAWVPDDQTAANWQDKVSLQLFPGATGVTGRELLDQLATRYDADCKELLATDTQVKEVRGRTVAFRFLGCTDYKNTGQGQIALFRTMQGEQSFYLMQRAWRTPTFARDTLPFQRDLLGKTRLWLQGGRICQANSSDPERACPPRLADPIARTSLEQPVAVVDLGDGEDSDEATDPDAPD